MADITGRVYETFVEFILQLLNYCDEWSNTSTKQYLYGKHTEALCHKSMTICPHAKECDAYSKLNQIPYGPWYDPDFFILHNKHPIGCLHITHWSQATTSPRKFWRTIEDHFQYKTFFGSSFISINLTFVTLGEGIEPKLVIESDKLISMHGWKPAVGSVHTISYDASILFPIDYKPLEKYIEILPEELPKNTRSRREICTELWKNLYKNDLSIRKEIDYIVSLLKEALAVHPNRYYSGSVINHLQNICFDGRKRIKEISPTSSRYRKGIQHTFILYEMLKLRWGKLIEPEQALWQVLLSKPRFLTDRFREMIGLSTEVSETEILEFRNLLAAIPVQVEKKVPKHLLLEDAGLGNAEWNNDFYSFLLDIQKLDAESQTRLKKNLRNLFQEYLSTHGISDTIMDLYDQERVSMKVDYVANNYLKYVDSVAEDTFVLKFAADMLTPGKVSEHQKVITDTYNWPLEIICLFYKIGTSEGITIPLSVAFRKRYKHELSVYAFNGTMSTLVTHLISGIKVGQFFSGKALLSEEEFYKAIWPLLAECIWKAILRKKVINSKIVEINYRYKKAMRIIAQSDLEPIKHIFLEYFPEIKKGSKIHGVFNQLSNYKGWSKQALTTDVSGKDPLSGASIQTQAVFGKKHIADKTREVSARLRSVQLRCASDGTFEPETNPGIHYLVVDGDWPVESKINLYEAGFKGIYEIGELEQLAEELNSLSNKKQ